MPGVPANRACERCKKRHVKCDETRPKCRRCTSAGVECPGYVQMRKFIDQGPTIRRRYAPYQDAHSRAHTENSLGQENNAQSSEPAETAAQDVGGDLSASQSPTSFHAAAGIPERPRDNRNYTESPPQTYGLQTTFVPPGPQYQPGAFGSSPIMRHQGSILRNNSSSATTPSAEIEPGQPEPNVEVGGAPSIQNEQENFHDIFSELMTGSEHEIAFLTRHFSEFLGPWLDISDTKKFFTVYAPIRAINNDFLKYAIAALSAKHLGRLDGQNPPATGGVSASPATMEVYPNSGRVDWILKGENYYYLAFTRMRDVISDEYGSVSSSAVLESPIEAMSRWLNMQLGRGGFTNASGTSDPDSFLRKIEALLGACAIFTMYKLLEAPGDHWPSLLVGIEPLFDSLLQIHASHPDLSPEFSHGERAALWNFARQDYLGSYFTRNPTHLKHDNLALWKAAGIRVSDQEPREVGASLEDLAANTLIRLLNKVVNFLADYKRSQVAHWNEEFERPTVPSTTAWLDLCFEFQNWLEKVPETFRPSLRIERPRDMSNLSEVAYLPFPEIFYSLESCAAAMQHYHFGRMALLLNRPPDAVSAPGTAFDRLASLREVTKEVDYRCREICGIALSRPRGEVRVYMAPLLFAVGQCLETAEARQVIIDLLRGVEAELGMATVTTANNLQLAWDQ